MNMTEDNIADLFRSNFRRIRVDRGLTQSDVARSMGKTPSYVCDLERGRRDPNVRTIASIADALRCDPAELFSFTLTTNKTKVPA